MNPQLTEIIYILDRSGSMQPLQESAIVGFNEMIQSQLDSPGDANVSLLLFDDEFLLVHDRRPIEEVGELDASTYVPRGTTALNDAIGRAIKGVGRKLSKEPEEKRPGKVIMAIYTDGYENASTDYTIEKVNRMITHQRKNYNWEFIFLAANQDAIATAGQMGIDSNMASAVQNSAKGMRDSSSSMNRKVMAMRATHRTEEQEADYKNSMEEIVKDEESRDSD